MAGFEVVVRPVVFPNIRPAPTRSLPPQDDPEKGFAVIQGNPCSSVGLSDSWSVSTSRSSPIESERRIDEVTVYQKEEDGTINKKNFVKLEVANKITTQEPSDQGVSYSPLPKAPPIMIDTFYAPVQQIDNIMIERTNIIKKNPDAPK